MSRVSSKHGLGCDRQGLLHWSCPRDQLINEAAWPQVTHQPSKRRGGAQLEVPEDQMSAA